MKPMRQLVSGTATAVFLIACTPALAQQEPAEITEKNRKLFEEFKRASGVANEKVRLKSLQTQAMANLQEIGIALFGFQKEYGKFPNEETTVALKEARSIKAPLAAATANDCFFQLVLAHLVADPRVFTFEKPEPPEEHDHGHDCSQHLIVKKCSFAFVSLDDTKGNPMRPLVVAPLLKGKTTFDPKVFGGVALILRADKSVTPLPIGEDGRVMVDGKDLFDPAQPYWKGKVPPIRWPAE
jgi:hypothetical protein